MECGWGHEEGGRGSRGEERREIHVALGHGHLREPLTERDRQQEREQDLDSGQRNPELVQELHEFAIELLVAAFAFVFSGRDGALLCAHDGTSTRFGDRAKPGV